VLEKMTVSTSIKIATNTSETGLLDNFPLHLLNYNYLKIGKFYISI